MRTERVKRQVIAAADRPIPLGAVGQWPGAITCKPIGLIHPAQREQGRQDNSDEPDSEDAGDGELDSVRQIGSVIRPLLDEIEHLCGLRFQNGAADQFGDLGDYGVSELFISVYPTGYPMTCSAVSGTGYRWPSTRLHQSCQLFRSGFATPCRGDCLPPLNAVALGAGHNPNSVPKLSGTSVGSRYAMPFSIIPDRGQVSENSAHSPSKQSCDVFHCDEIGSKLAKQSEVFAPEPTTCAVKTRSKASKTDVLTWESSNDSVGLDSVSAQSIGGKLSNIVIDRHPGEAMGERGASLAVDFTGGNSLEPARSLKAKVEAANASEKGKDAIHLSRTLLPNEPEALPIVDEHQLLNGKAGSTVASAPGSTSEERVRNLAAEVGFMGFGVGVPSAAGAGHRRVHASPPPGNLADSPASAILLGVEAAGEREWLIAVRELPTSRTAVALSGLRSISPTGSLVTSPGKSKGRSSSTCTPSVSPPRRGSGASNSTSAHSGFVQRSVDLLTRRWIGRAAHKGIEFTRLTDRITRKVLQGKFEAARSRKIGVIEHRCPFWGGIVRRLGQPAKRVQALGEFAHAALAGVSGLGRGVPWRAVKPNRTCASRRA